MVRTAQLCCGDAAAGPALRGSSAPPSRASANAFLLWPGHGDNFGGGLGLTWGACAGACAAAAAGARGGACRGADTGGAACDAGVCGQGPPPPPAQRAAADDGEAAWIYSMYYRTEFSEFLPRGRPAVSHKVVPAAAAPPSNLGGRVTSEKGLKEWHAKQALSQMSALQGLLIVNILGQ